MRYGRVEYDCGSCARHVDANSICVSLACYEGPMNTSLERKASILRCPSCGAWLCVLPDMERFACKHCAAEQVVVRQGGTTALKLLDYSGSE